MVADPLDKLFSFGSTRRDIENDPFSLLNGRVELPAVQQQENLHRSVTDALVSINEWMVLDHRVAERSSLLLYRAVEILPTEGNHRLGNCRLQATEIANLRRTAGLFNDEPMQIQDLGKREIPHLTEPSIQFLVLLQDSRSSFNELIILAGKQFLNSRRGEIINRHVEALGYFLKPFLLGAIHFDRDLHAVLLQAIIRRQAISLTFSPENLA